MAVDWSNPCARYAALRDAYYANLTGGGETLIRTKGPESEREVRFNKQNSGELLAAMRIAYAECQALNGLPNTSGRFAIRGGSRRSVPSPDDGWNT